MNKQEKSKLIFVLVVFVMVMSTIFGFAQTFMHTMPDYIDEYDFNSKWEISSESILKEAGSFRADGLNGNVHKDDKLVMVNTIPRCEIKNQMAINMKLYLSAIDVYLDNKMIYSRGKIEYEKGEMPGSGFHVIPLPTDCFGKKIKIIIYVGEENAFSDLNEIWLVDVTKIHSAYLKNTYQPIFIAIFLFVCGIIAILMGLIATIILKKPSIVIADGVLCLLIGYWSMISCRFLDFFTTEFQLTTTLEYISLYACMFPFLQIVIVNFKGKIDDWKVNIIRAFMGIHIIFMIVATVLHFTNISHYPDVLGFFHIFGAITAITIILLGVSSVFKLPIETKILYISIFYLCTMLCLDAFRFNVEKYINENNTVIGVSIAPFAGMSFVILSMMSFAIGYIENSRIQSENELLRYIEEYDKITGFYNYAKCEELFDYLNKQHNHYKIMSIDFEGLKKTEEKYGFETRDKMVQNFADALWQAFGEYGMIYRMGSDKFLIAFQEKYTGNIEDMLVKLSEIVTKKSADLPGPFNYFYGIACPSDTEWGFAEEVYREADERRYEMKVRAKVRMRGTGHD